ncbi:hypothetical protein E1262_07135 [Jiangella aurantiaca]|uniref:Uncharacterized protein n=1 Tax=Jiangella aurantiaca TaxID=2530373 RepID=A0A4R5AIT7_9ACTN|nr:hypothetical protein [Jiangella aurantiaca]TDD71366.1 hypothetical protein E1262_07135 [Jiangella aurantiaca]
MSFITFDLGGIMELQPSIGVGAGDLQHAVRAETARILRETKGDALAQSKLLLGRIRDLDLITEAEVDSLYRLAEIEHEAAAERTDAGRAYLESRAIYNDLLARGGASPVALVLASSSVGSYTITGSPDRSGGVVFKKNTGAWESRGQKIGALVGANWGPAGAAIGGAIGGAVGAAVDGCLD